MSSATNLKDQSMLAGILLQMTDEVDRLLLSSISQELGKAGYGLITGVICDDCSIGQSMEKLLEFNVDGLIIRPRELSEDIPDEKLKQLKVPLLLVDTTDSVPDYAEYVGTDDNECGKLAAEHLLKLGHRVFTIVDSDDAYSPMSTRAVAFAEYVRIHCPDCHMNHVQVAFNKRLAMKPRALFCNKPTAVFCTGDYLLPGLYYAAEVYGYRIPDDLSVVSVGRLREYSYLQPRVTGVRQDFKSMGREAVSRLLGRINPALKNKDLSQVQQHLYFELGDSSAPPNKRRD